MDYFPHQLEYVTQHYNKEYHGLWWAMGAGKTRAILDGAARLYAEGERPTHGQCPAVTSEWGQDWLRRLRTFFAATGITDGDLMNGVHFDQRGATTESLVMRSRTGTVRHITARHSQEKANEILEA